MKEADLIGYPRSLVTPLGSVFLSIPAHGTICTDGQKTSKICADLMSCFCLQYML